MKFLILTMSAILITGTFSFAELQNKQGSSKTGRKLDLRLSRKSPVTFDEARHSNDGYERIEMSQFKEFETSNKPKASARMNCKTPSGVTYKQNQPGFEDCLRQAEYERSSHHSPSDPNSTAVGADFDIDN